MIWDIIPTLLPITIELLQTLQVCCPLAEELDLIEKGEKQEDYYDYGHIYQCDHELPGMGYLGCGRGQKCVSRTECGKKGMTFLGNSNTGQSVLGRVMTPKFLTQTRYPFWIHLRHENWYF